MVFNFNYKTHVCFQLPSNLCKKAAFAKITDLQIRVNFPNFWCDVSPVFLTNLSPLYFLDQLHLFLRSVFVFHFHYYQDFLFLDISTMEEVIERIGKIQVESCEKLFYMAANVYFLYFHRHFVLIIIVSYAIFSFWLKQRLFWSRIFVSCLHGVTLKISLRSPVSVTSIESEWLFSIMQ